MHYTYKKIALIKILLGVIILIATISTINVFADEVLGLAFFLLSIFLIVRGSGYFVFRLLQYTMKQYNKYEYEKMAEAYKLSFLFACYVLINIILILIEKRTRLIGINLLLAFVIIQILLIYDRNENE